MLVNPEDITDRTDEHSLWTAPLLPKDNLSRGYVCGEYVGFKEYGRIPSYLFSPSAAKEKITVLSGGLFVRTSLGDFGLTRGGHKVNLPFVLYRLERQAGYDPPVFKREFNLISDEFKIFEFRDRWNTALVKFMRLQTLLLRGENPSSDNIQRAFHRIEE